ncbi:acyltransferase family protein [Vagococcus xieshaowenii]|uniref:acyltransferase family protein n=1 Tax=Vagococcus xieshaowenii TaxID=2562451 RepID=UPI001432731E|nr:acyltransferase family protein [Vagococcus xieshaowenii]
MRTKRDSYFDNAKFILIILVVFTHFFMGMTEKRGIYEDIYYLLFTIHMPTFILISGFFSKNIFKDKKCLKKSIHFLWLYVLFQVLYTIFYFITGIDHSFHLSFLVPEWSLWFLLSMSFWYIGLFVLKKVPPYLAITVSLLLAILVGYLPEVGRELSLQRAFVFFPYFLIGFHLPKQFFEVFQSKKMKYVGGVALIILLFYVVAIDGANKYWFFGSKAYDDFMDLPEFGALIRLLFYCLSVIGVCGFLSLVPTKRQWYTDYGKNTLIVYLFHGFIVKLLRQYIPFESLSFIPSIIIFSFSALFISTLLATNSIKRATNWIITLF